MRKFLTALFLFISCISFAQTHLNVLTFNIRFDTPRDSINAWPNRKHFAASQVLFHEAHIVGVQEALHHQLEDMQQEMKRFKWIGVARDDGKSKGEYSAIFYDSTRLKYLSGSTFWLSENPGVVGKAGWDAALPRIATWAKFRDRKTGKIFYVFNTHFDHMGKNARWQSAKLLLQKIKTIAGQTPVVVTGDFNSDPTSDPIEELVNKLNADRLTDTKEISRQPHYGPTGTFNAFGPKETTDQPIDYIFIKGKIKVLQHATLSQTWAGRFSSDHFPVFAKVVVE